ncbi:MAG: heat-shock protein [Bdellovibrionaceae bacterium]|nr:heat-shock protein [Pseudobdellovibrionaceae bacterium]|tara:strand:+ start:55355 stop:55834 length:480 start_codon:yes stop_codon:yes gene_type:complete
MRGLTTYKKHPLDTDFFSDFDRVFEGFLKPVTSSERFGFTPKLDIEEDKDHFLLHLDVPGMKEEDIRVEIEDNILSIAGERKRESRSEGKLTSWERSYGRFERRLSLPNTVNSESIEAHYENGVLSLYIPKEEAKQPKQIKVEKNKDGFFNRLLGGTEK